MKHSRMVVADASHDFPRRTNPLHETDPLALWLTCPPTVSLLNVQG